LIKLNRSGGIIWSNKLERSNGHRFLFVKQTIDGDYIVVGELGTFTIDPKVVLAKLDSHGKLIWKRVYSSPQPLFLRVFAMTLTSDEEVLLVGSYGSSAFLMKVNSDGSIAWSKIFSYRPHALSLSSVVRTKNRGYVAAGSSDQFRGGDNRGLLIRVNSVGKLLWSRRTDSELFSVDQTSDNGFIASGLGVNFYGILKTNSRGLIPGCSLLRRFPLSARSLQIKRLADENLKLEAIDVQTESFTITPKSISVDGEDYCNK
jgi:outer membrane protein assembly factor BamB